MDLNEVKKRNMILAYEYDSLIIPLFNDEATNYYQKIAYDKLTDELARNNIELTPNDELEGEICIDLANKDYEIALCLADTIKQDYKVELHIPIEPTFDFKKLASKYFIKYVFSKYGILHFMFKL